MLRLRVLTALALLLLLTAALLAPSPWPFIVLVALVCALAGWEWLRMTADSSRVGAGTAIGLFVLIVWQAVTIIRQPEAVLQLGSQPGGWWWLWALDVWPALVAMLMVLLACVVWLIIGPLAVIYARVDAPGRSMGLSLFAVLALGATGLVLVFMFLSRGAWYVVSLLIVVWLADSAAYFVGRAWGRHKLAPCVSPGKSVQGAVAGMLAAVVWVLASGQFEHTFGQALIARWGGLAAVPLAALLAAASILGDLFESLVKRRAGVKDSSQLLPGHGGVWDRVDAVLPVVPLAALLTGI